MLTVYGFSEESSSDTHEQKMYHALIWDKEVAVDVIKMYTEGAEF